MRYRLALVSIVAPAALGLSMFLGAATHAGPPGLASGDDQSAQANTQDKSKNVKKAKVGEVAPDFVLMDASGKPYRLSDNKGKIVVLQWINPGCPVCRRVASSGVVGRMVEDLMAIDKNIVHMAIDSTKTMEPDDSAKYLKDHKIAAPALADKDGTVGHLYGAKTTPHMFVIDGKGILRYSGAIDDDPRGGKGKEAVNYVVNAVKQIVAGETVAPDSVRSYGCSVKYARAGGDSDRGGRGSRGGGRRGGGG